jgi:hypothetical protein
MFTYISINFWERIVAFHKTRKHDREIIPLAGSATCPFHRNCVKSSKLLHHSSFWASCVAVYHLFLRSQRNVPWWHFDFRRVMDVFIWPGTEATKFWVVVHHVATEVYFMTWRSQGAVNVTHDMLFICHYLSPLMLFVTRQGDAICPA